MDLATYHPDVIKIYQQFLKDEDNMPNIADIQGITGPGRVVNLVLSDADEVTFRFGKGIIEIKEKNGNLGQYDLAQTSTINVSSEPSGFLITVRRKNEEGEPDGERAGEVVRTDTGPVEIGAAGTQQPAGIPPKLSGLPEK